MRKRNVEMALVKGRSQRLRVSTRVIFKAHIYPILKPTRRLFTWQRNIFLEQHSPFFLARGISIALANKLQIATDYELIKNCKQWSANIVELAPTGQISSMLVLLSLRVSNVKVLALLFSQYFCYIYRLIANEVVNWIQCGYLVSDHELVSSIIGKLDT